MLNYGALSPRVGGPKSYDKDFSIVTGKETMNPKLNGVKSLLYYQYIQLKVNIKMTVTAIAAFVTVDNA